MRFLLLNLMSALGVLALFAITGCTKFAISLGRIVSDSQTSTSTGAAAATTIAISECTDDATTFVDSSTVTNPIFARRTPVNMDTVVTSFSWDGRVVLGTNIVNNVTGWYLQATRPEKITKENGVAHFIFNDSFSPKFLLENNGTVSSATKLDEHGMAFRNSTAMTPVPGLAQNPYRSDAAGVATAAGAFETYRVYLFSSNYHPDLAAIGRREAFIVVSNPKTANAQIQAAWLTSTQQSFTTTTGTFLRGIEPAVSHDGRLIIYQGRPENDGRILSLVYSYNANPLSLTGWSPVRSLADLYYAESQTVIDGISFRDRYPLARRPIVKPTGIAYVAGETYTGAYPWLSQEADFLTHSTIISGLEGRDRTLRGGHSYVSADEFILHHIDGPLNRNREGRTPNVITVRTLTPSPGLFSTLWAPFSDVPNLMLPASPFSRVMPLVDIVAMDYIEVPIELPDGEYIVKYPMNELVAHNDAPEVATVDFTKTPDVSGNFITAQLTGGAAFPLEYNGTDDTPGANGVAIYFPSTALVRAPLVPKFSEIRGAITVQTWVKPMVEDGTERLIAYLPGSFAVVLNPTGFRVSINVGTTRYDSEPAGTIPMGVWTHTAFTYNAASGELKLFVNGDPVWARTYTPGSINVATADLLIGPNGSGGPGTTGQAVYLLDEFAISKVVRSSEELTLAAFRDRKPKRNVASVTLPLGLRVDELYTYPAATSAQVELGKLLFHDVRLSGSKLTSCASCHLPGQNFAENKILSMGANGRTLPRNTPSLLNRAFAKSFFRDGRSATLQQALLEPLHHQLEMNSKVCRVVSWLKQTPTYVDKFQTAYQAAPSAVSFSQALQAYQLSLLTGNSRFDQYQAGNVGQLSASELRGKNLFFGKARCFGCHKGSNFSDETFHNIGVSRDLGDLGRSFSTTRALDVGAFRTPSLRGVANTAPYFHDGSAATLRDVVDFYSNGGRQSTAQTIEIRPVNLDASERNDLVDFLSSLSSDGLDTAIPTPLKALDPIYPTSAAQTESYPADVNSRRVVLAYQVLLGRVPDPAGFAAWRALLDAKKLTRQTFLSQLFYSPEFTARHDVGKRGSASFVVLLYEILLQRTPVPSEIDGWKQTLENDATREAVFLAFANSPEFIAKNPGL